MSEIEHVTADVGRIVPLYRFDYSDETEYELNDIVKYNDNLYWHFSAEKTTGAAPTDTTVWRLALEPSMVSIDDTLSIEGKAADAKVVGDAFANIADYPVELGTSNNWNYQKWASGRMTATRIVVWTNVAFTQSYTADGVPIGATVTMSQIELPNGLISAPDIIPACNHFAGYLIAVIDGISKAYATPRLIRLFSTSAIDEASFVLKLEGRWKESDDT